VHINLVAASLKEAVPCFCSCMVKSKLTS